MKRFILLCLLLITACTPAAKNEPIAQTYTAPIPRAPSDIEFIDSDITVAWDWPALQTRQAFALRVWYDDAETPQEVWLRDTEANIQPMIDSYSQAVGAFHWQVAVVNTYEDGGFDSMGSEWSPISTLHRVRRYTLEPLPLEAQSEMARYISEQGLTSPFEIANFTRDFVHNNTHITTQGDYGADFSAAMQLVFDHSQGKGEAPELYCDGMSTGMLTVFLELGIESRLVYLYGETKGWIGQHTFLEVFNTDTQQWEVHDPTFNLYFVDSETGKRANVERMIFGDLDTLMGCNTAGECSRAALSESVEQYLGAFRTAHASNEVWVNPNRFNISRRVTALENNNFPEFVARMTGIPQRDLIFHFDNWETMPVAENES